MELVDTPASDHVQLVSSTTEFVGPVFTILNDEVVFNSGDRACRSYMVHDDAVAIVAVRPAGDSWEVLLIRQYRHAPRRIMWEIPAGLCDIPGESLEEVAARELAEETGYGARQWQRLVSFLASAGVSDEEITIFLAQDPYEETDVHFERRAEEREISVHWVDIAEVQAAIFRGDVRSPSLVTGVLAAISILNKSNS